MNFKEYLLLFEAPMNSRTFLASAKKLQDAKVGFEFEFGLSADHPFAFKGDNDRESLYLRELITVDDYYQYFEMPYAVVRNIGRSYSDFRETEAEEWAKRKVGTADDVEFEDAKQEFLDDNSNYDFQDFLLDKYGSYYAFVDDLDLSPRYGWRVNSKNESASFYIEEDPDEESIEDRQERVYKIIAQSLQQKLKVPVIATEFDADIAYAEGKWVVMFDGSVETEDENIGDVAVEVASPPYPLPKAIVALEKMFDWMVEHDAETNRTTGLHINISLPEDREIDLVKLVLFMGDEYLLKQFDRLGNQFTYAQTRRILNNLDTTGTLPKEANQLITLARAALSKEKYSSVNISKLSQGYLEFRIAGNKNYHRQANLIKKTIFRYIAALDIASDPDAWRNEYLKKLTKVFGKAAEVHSKANFDHLKIRTILDAGDFNEIVVPAFDDFFKNLKTNTSDSFRSRAKDWFNEIFMRTLFVGAGELNLEKATPRHAAELKLLAKKFGVDLQEPLDDKFAESRRKELKKIFNF